MGRPDLKKWAKRDPVVAKTLEEADAAGATLHHDGGGGLDAGLALGVYRRDEWRCRLCGTSEDLELDHIDGHPGSTPDIPDLKGKNVPENLAVVCHKCQDVLHQVDRNEQRGVRSARGGRS